MNYTEVLLTRICALLKLSHRRATEERDKAEVDQQKQNDWRLAAAITDRILFLALSFVFLTGTFVFGLIFSLSS